MALAKRFLLNMIDKVNRDDLFTQAAALSFYTAISMAPLLILFAFLLSPFGLNLQGEFFEQARILVGKEAASSINALITKATANEELASRANWIGVVFLLVSASAVFAQLQSSLNIIFGSAFNLKSDAAWHVQLYHVLVRRVISFGMVLTFIFISIVSLMISSALTLLSFGNTEGGWQWFHFGLHFIVFSCLFAALFKFMPDKNITTRSAVQGGAVTSGLFVVGKSLIGAYLAYSARHSSFLAGPLIALLVWVYYSSLIVFVGAEVCVTMATEKEAASMEELA